MKRYDDPFFEHTIFSLQEKVVAASKAKLKTELGVGMVQNFAIFKCFAPGGRTCSQKIHQPISFEILKFINSEGFLRG